MDSHELVARRFQIQRYSPHLDQTDKPWVKAPNDGWGPVEDSCGCVDQAFIEADRHRAWWEAKGVKVKPEHMRVVELSPEVREMGRGNP